MTAGLTLLSLAVCWCSTASALASTPRTKGYHNDNPASH